MRLRPITMTSLAFIFGCVPLWIAMGAGMNARHSLGTGIIGGMIGASSLALLFVPLFFYLFEQLAERGKKDETAPVEGGGAPELATAPHAKREDH
jgi:multidrug efflux pump